MEMLVIALIVIVAFAAVLFPLFRRRPGAGDEREFENVQPADTAVTRTGPPDSLASQQPGGEDAALDPIEGEVLRYREAVRAGTVCRKCGQANPADSIYCSECGARLPRADAKEFE